MFDPRSHAKARENTINKPSRAFAYPCASKQCWTTRAVGADKAVEAGFCATISYRTVGRT